MPATGDGRTEELSFLAALAMTRCYAADCASIANGSRTP